MFLKQNITVLFENKVNCAILILIKNKKGDTVVNGEDAYTGKIAENYEMDRCNEAIWKTEHEYFENYIKSLPVNSKLLDMPFGTGRFVELYRKYGIDFVGCDISRAMLDVAKNKYGLPDNVLLQGDGEHLPFRDGEFSYTICCRFTHLVSTECLRNIIGELARTTTKQLVVHFFSLIEVKKQETLFMKFLRYFKKMLVLPIKSLRKIASAKNNLPWSHIKNYFHAQAVVEQMFVNANLKIIKHDVLSDEQYKVDVYVLEKNI